jgi:polypeptide N-acetylgalactosaminyltransferase
MDDYASFYFKMNARSRAAADRQDVSQRLALRRQLGCRSFAWYLDAVWPEHFLPRPGRFFGRLEAAGRPGRCLQKPARRPGTHSSQPTGPAALQALWTG